MREWLIVVGGEVFVPSEQSIRFDAQGSSRRAGESSEIFDTTGQPIEKSVMSSRDKTQISSR